LISNNIEIFQEDWDDSTLSSNVSKMRMQDRMEAATRRERALAYAFSQQVNSKNYFNKQVSKTVQEALT